MKKIACCILLTTASLGAWPQSELTQPFMRDIFQSTYINPSLRPEHPVSIGIATVFGQTFSNGFVPNNVAQFRNDTLRVNPKHFLDDLKDKNALFAGGIVDLLHLRIKVRNGYYWVGARSHANLSFTYPKDLVGLMVRGNGAYVGSSLEFSNLKMLSTAYNEYTLGAMLDYSRWSFGGRISLLQGIASTRFQSQTLRVDIDNGMYEHHGYADAKLYTAGIPRDSKGDPRTDISLDEAIKRLSYFKNKGFALSGGVTYRYDDRTQLSFSFYDLGFIAWKDSVETYTLKGETRFDGLNMAADWLYGGSVNADSILQSFGDNFKRDTISASYRTWLYPKFVLSANYDLARRTSVGFSFTGVYNQHFAPALTVGLQQGIGRFFNVVATASFSHRTFRNLGLGVLLKPGSLQIFAVADNLYPVINPLYVNNANLRVGLNLVFGRVKQPEGMPYR